MDFPGSENNWINPGIKKIYRDEPLKWKKKTMEKGNSDYINVCA